MKLTIKILTYLIAIVTLTGFLSVGFLDIRTVIAFLVIEAQAILVLVYLK